MKTIEKQSTQLKVTYSEDSINTKQLVLYAKLLHNTISHWEDVHGFTTSFYFSLR